MGRLVASIVNARLERARRDVEVLEVAASVLRDNKAASAVSVMRRGAERLLNNAGVYEAAATLVAGVLAETEAEAERGRR